MAITAPPPRARVSLPQFPLDTLSPEHRSAAQHIHRLLDNLVSYETQLHAAVLLADSCEREWNLIASRHTQGSPPGAYSLPSTVETLGDWIGMAARDGALAIYHFGNTMTAIRRSLGSFPLMNEAVDHATIKLADSEYRKAFPRYEAIRHVVSHAADFQSTQRMFEKHARRGSLKTPRLEITEGIRASGSVVQRTFIVDYEGKSYTYDITQANADKLQLTRIRVYSALGLMSKVGP